MFNFMELVFLNFALFVTLTGFLINHFRKYVPEFVIQTYLYGCFSYKGEKLAIVKPLEMSKSLFRHYYLFSVIYSVFALMYMGYIYTFSVEINWYLKEFLQLVLSNRATVSALASYCALLCLTIQCVKRLYETFYVQVFAKSSKMNLSHYIAGMFHYFGCITAIMGQASGFNGDLKKIIWLDTYTLVVILPSITLFLKGCYEQYRTNVIFAKLRKDDKMQRIVTEDYKIPRGRWFEIVSSPHRLTEIMMYTALLLLIPTKTLFCIYLWVIGNQVQTALQAHWWYQATFKDYPKNRYVIFPYVF